MTLMTDDIEWYPLPEVEEDDDAEVELKSTLSALSTTTHSSVGSTALSQSYLTPALSVASSHSRSDPHVTGTVQPYLRRRRAPRHLSPTDSADSAASQQRSSSSSLLLSGQRSKGQQVAASRLKHVPVSVPRQASSTESFKTAKSSAAGLKTMKSASSFQTVPSSASFKTAQMVPSSASFMTAQTAPSSASFKTAQTAPSSASFKTAQTVPSSASFKTAQTAPSSASFKTAQSSETAVVLKNLQTVDSSRSLATETTSSASFNQEKSSASFETAHSASTTSSGTGHSKDTPAPSMPQDLSMSPTLTSPALSLCERESQQHSPSTETTKTPAPIPFLPSAVFATGVKLSPNDRQQTTISLVELDRLWMEFLVSSLGGLKRAEEEEEEGGVRHPPVPLLHTTPSSREGTPSEQDEECVLEMRDTAIQTTPSLQLSSRPVAFTVASHLNQHISQPSTQCRGQQAPHLSRLTLQESLRILRPDFVHRSEERQRALERNRELQYQRWAAAVDQQRLSGEEDRFRHSGRDKNSHRSPRFILIDVTKNRPKMSPLEMYHNSKKHWSKLPEVQQKVHERKKTSEAATNRLRMKLYQQEVLGRLRQNRK